MIPFPAVYRNILVKLKIQPAIVDHIMQKQDVEILAKNLQDWQTRSRKK